MGFLRLALAVRRGPSTPGRLEVAVGRPAHRPLDAGPQCLLSNGCFDG
jgi:hypothetical protein